VKPEPLVPKASLESKPADLAARLAMLVRQPDQADVSKRGADQRCTARAPASGEAGLLLEELDDIDEPPDHQEVLSEGDRGCTKTMRAELGSSAPSSLPGSQAAATFSRDPAEWSMPIGGGGAPGWRTKSLWRARGGPAELGGALCSPGPWQGAPWSLLELTELTPLEAPGGPHAEPPAYQGRHLMKVAGAPWCWARQGRQGWVGGRGWASPWVPHGPFQVSQASVAMGVGRRRSAGSIRLWGLPRGSCRP